MTNKEKKELSSSPDLHGKEYEKALFKLFRKEMVNYFQKKGYEIHKQDFQCKPIKKKVYQSHCGNVTNHATKITWTRSDNNLSVTLCLNEFAAKSNLYAETSLFKYAKRYSNDFSSFLKQVKKSLKERPYQSQVYDVNFLGHCRESGFGTVRHCLEMPSVARHCNDKNALQRTWGCHCDYERD